MSKKVFRQDERKPELFGFISYVYLRKRTFLIGFLGILMPSVEGFKYLGVKRKLSQKAKVSICWLIYVASLTYGHEL